MDQFNIYKSSDELISKSLQDIKPFSGNILADLLLLVVASIAAHLIFVSSETMELISSTTSLFLTCHLALLGCIVAVYSLLYALLRPKVAKILIAQKEKGLHGYDYYSGYFQRSMMLQFLGLFLSFLLSFLISITNLHAGLLFPERYQSFYFLLLDIYFWFELRTVWEFKSVIFNIVCMVDFSMAASIALETKEDAKTTAVKHD